MAPPSGSSPRPVRTSADSPIEVGWVYDEDGRIGLTFAPGKKGPAVATGVFDWDRDLDDDLARLRGHYGCEVLFSLIEDFEFDMLRMGDLVGRARAHGIEVVRFPIPDLTAPPVPAIRPFVERAVGLARTGHTVVAHCRGGRGRAGLFGAACRVLLGDDAPTAIATARRARQGAVETREQEAFVAAFARAVTGS